MEAQDPQYIPRYYLKLQSITGGIGNLDTSVYVKTLPCLVGRESSLAINMKGKDFIQRKTNPDSHSFEIDLKKQSTEMLNILQEHEVTQKLTISPCKSM